MKGTEQMFCKSINKLIAKLTVLIENNICSDVKTHNFMCFALTYVYVIVFYVLNIFRTIVFSSF